VNLKERESVFEVAVADYDKRGKRET